MRYAILPEGTGVHIQQHIHQNDLNLCLSSNINEVIKAVLNSFFFLLKDFARTKSTKRHKDTRVKAQKCK